jgi:PadR family transcriptional regulator PadR
LSVSENIKRATIEMLILSLLTQQSMYGYQLCQELKKRSKGQLILIETSIYPILSRMKKKGLVSCRQELVGERRNRVYYHLEPLGEEHRQAIKKEYFSLHTGVVKILETVQENFDVF